MVFKPYLVLKERSLVRLKNHTRQLEGNMRKVCCIDCQRRENCVINNALAFAMNFGLPKTRDFVPSVKYGGNGNLLDVLMQGTIY